MNTPELGSVWLLPVADQCFAPLDAHTTMATGKVVARETAFALVEFPHQEGFFGAPPRRWVPCGMFLAGRAEPARRGF